MKIIVNRNLLAACNVVASTEGTRYYLRGVHVSRNEHGTYYVATDGHALLMAHDASQAGEPVDLIVPSEIISAPKRKEPKEDVLEITADRLLLAGRARAPMQEGTTYPDVLRVIPRAASRETKIQVAISPVIVAQFAKVGKILRPLGRHSRDPVPEFLPTGDENDPCIVRYAGRDDVLGVAMPMRMSMDPWTRPVWADGWLATPQEAAA